MDVTTAEKREARAPRTGLKGDSPGGDETPSLSVSTLVAFTKAVKFIWEGRLVDGEDYGQKRYNIETGMVIANLFVHSLV